MIFYLQVRNRDTEAEKNQASYPCFSQGCKFPNLDLKLRTQNLTEKFTPEQDSSQGNALVAQPCLTLLLPRGPQPRQAPLSVGFSRQEYWSGLPFSPPEDPPDPGIEPGSPASSALAGRLFATEPLGKLGPSKGKKH